MERPAAKVQREAVLLETASVAAAAVDASIATPWVRKKIHQNENDEKNENAKLTYLIWL